MTTYTNTSPQTTDYGGDVSVFPDLDPTFTEINGPQVVAEDIAASWSMPQGACEDDEDAGFYAVTLLSKPMNAVEAFRAQQRLETEALKDERVYSCSVQLTWNTATREMLITAYVDCLYGAFRLVASVDRVTLKLLGIQ
jgi:hypothetical protein